MEYLSSLFASFGFFFSSDPSVFALQISLVVVGLLVVFLVLFTTRDILLRSDSFFVQMLCILLAAALPIIGFLLYLLVRPAMTLKDRKLLRMMEKILSKTGQQQHRKPQQQHPQKEKKPQLIA